MPLHAHAIAVDVCGNGTSMRRYVPVRLVQVPEEALPAWRCANKKKAKNNPRLAQFGDSEMELACLKCTHFCGANKLVAEGNRTHLNIPGGTPLKLLADDMEGKMIRKEGVQALVYSEQLWYDKPALMALMREDNANTGQHRCRQAGNRSRCFWVCARDCCRVVYRRF